MIDALIAGKLQGQTMQLTGRCGEPFTVAKVRTNNGNGEALFVNVIAFSHETVHALLALRDGDTLSATGTITVRIETDRSGKPWPSVDLIASQVMTPYHVVRKRKAMAPEPFLDGNPPQIGFEDYCRYQPGGGFS